MNQLFHTWMWWVSSLAFILALGSCVSVEEMNIFRSNVDMGCAVGGVTHNEALVWVKTKGPQEVKILYTTDPLWIATQETFLISTSGKRFYGSHTFGQSDPAYPVFLPAAGSWKKTRTDLSICDSSSYGCSRTGHLCHWGRYPSELSAFFHYGVHAGRSTRFFCLLGRYDLRR